MLAFTIVAGCCFVCIVYTSNKYMLGSAEHLKSSLSFIPNIVIYFPYLSWFNANDGNIEVADRLLI